MSDNVLECASVYVELSFISAIFAVGASGASSPVSASTNPNTFHESKLEPKDTLISILYDLPALSSIPPLVSNEIFPVR